MRIRWKLVLPIVGLLLFASETYHSVRMNHEAQWHSSRYFWSSFIRLDSDPLNRRPQVAVPCSDGGQNCTQWELRSVWVDPGLLTRALVITAFPAFAVVAIIVSGLGHLGINEIWSFLISAPFFIFGWFYFVGWLVDRWKSKRAHQS